MAWKVPGSNENGSGAPDNNSGNSGRNPWPPPRNNRRRGGNGNPLDALRKLLGGGGGDGDGGFTCSDTLDVARDFSSIFSELEFSEDDGLDAFDVLEETLSVFSTCVFGVSFLLSMLGISTFFPVKVIKGLSL